MHRQLAVGNEQTGTKPIDVTIPTGPLAEICASVNDAYRDIQNEQEQWKFRTKQGTLNLTPNGTNTISLATIQGQITDYDRLLFFTPNSNRYLRSYLSSAGATTSGYCYFMPYQCWRGWQDAGTLPSGQPQQFTQLPDQSL